MYFFEKRPLGIILCILLGGFSLFSLFENSVKWILLGVASLILLALLFLVKKIGKFPLVASIVLLLSFGLSWFYFSWYFPIYDRYPNHYTVEGKITSVIYAESYEVLVAVKTQSIDSAPVKSRLLVSFVPTEKENLSIEINDKISFKGKIKNLETAEFGFDQKQYYQTQGIQGFVENAQDTKLTENSAFSILRFVYDIRKKVIQYIRSSADETTSGLLCALITGEKSELPGSIRLNFKRIGLSHILAVSGMHLAILTTGLHKLLSLLTVDKKWRCLIAMLFVLFYMGITGFSVSVLRAGGMLLISNLLFLLSKTRDSFTNLMISVSLIFIISPYAVHDISLLLSFFATIGVLAALRLLESIPYQISKWKKFFIAVFSSLLTSFLAISMTLPFSVFIFGRLSTIAPLTTLIFSFLVELFIYIGSIFLLLGAPSFLLSPVSWLANQISELSAYISRFDWCYISARGNETQILCVFFYVFLFAFLIFKIKRKKLAFATLLTLFLSIFVIGYISTENVLENDRIVYFSDAQNNDSILLIDKKIATAVAMPANSIRNANYFLHQIDQEDILDLQYLWIPQYTPILNDFLFVILSTMPVQNILLPEPKDFKENTILSEVSLLCTAYGSNYITIAEGDYIEFAETKLYSVYRAPMEDGFQVILSLQHEGEYYTYFSRGAIEEKCSDTANRIISVSRALIFGCNGKKYKNSYYLEFSSEHTDILAFQSDDVLLTDAVYDAYKSRAKFYYKEKKISLLD